MRGLDPNLLRVASAGLAFGALIAVSAFLAWRLGGWLDARWDTEPLFSAVLVLLAIVGSFIELLRQLRRRS